MSEFGGVEWTVDHMRVLLPVAILVGYLVVVRSLRFRRINDIQQRHGSTPAQYQRLGYREAQHILGQLGLYECPWVFLAGKDFAFLRAFAIPGISKVSVSAKEMVDRVGKRYADTTVLVGEFLVNDIDSERACIAINRMNWIHSRYGSQIKMDQMVYTLCLLICEALLWIDKYDWRQTTPLEKHASWVFWYEVGRRMGLQDVPKSFEACAAYIESFESKKMAPSRDNALIAEGVFSLYASTMPAFLTPIVHAVLKALMDKRLSNAFEIARDPARPLVLIALNGFLIVRKFFVRRLMLPRRSTMQIFGEPNKTGHRSMMFWEIEPWYVATTQGSNWLYSVYARVFGLPLAGDSRYRPEGYKLEELGPKHLEGKGGKEILAFVRKTEASSFTTFGQFSNVVYTRDTCPMASTAIEKGSAKRVLNASARAGLCPLLSISHEVAPPILA